MVHGETLVEPVAPGTNRAAIDAPDVDVLAHPGMITVEEARDAAARGCLVEITTKPGHALSNGHVARVCREAGAAMVVNSDAHGPGDIARLSWSQTVAAAAGLSPEEVQAATITHPQRFVQQILARRR